MSSTQPRRTEERVAADDAAGRRELHRRGFHLEGRLRQARPRGDGWVDELIYARLDTDPVGPEAHRYVMNSVTPRKRLIAHALVRDEAGRILLCETSFKQDWELPGGIVEPGESPRAGCSREMVEEMGISPELGGVLVVDWLRPYRGWEDAVELVFATSVVSEETKDRMRPDGQEILQLHWVTLTEAQAMMTPFGAARLTSAVTAQEQGVTLYTEAGEPIHASPSTGPAGPETRGWAEPLAERMRSFIAGPPSLELPIASGVDRPWNEWGRLLTVLDQLGVSEESDELYLGYPLYGAEPPRDEQVHRTAQSRGKAVAWVDAIPGTEMNWEVVRADLRFAGQLYYGAPRAWPALLMPMSMEWALETYTVTRTSHLYGTLPESFQVPAWVSSAPL